MLLGELATVVRYRLPIKIIVVKNDSLGQIKWEQMMFLGNPEYECDAAADRLRQGGRGIRPARLPGRARRGLRPRPRRGARASAARSLVEAIIDPAEPLLPPKRMPNTPTT